jgi:hypothetical protein
VQDHTARILECMIPGVPSARLRIQQPAIDFQGPQRNVVERRRLMKLRHVVLFGFGKAQSPAATAEVIRRFVELKALVPDIDDFDWGENSSPEGLDRGHSHAFLLTFASARARRLPCASRSHSLFELGPAICVFGDGSGLLGRNDAQLSPRKRVQMEIIRQMLQPHRPLLWRPARSHDP